MSGAEDLDGDLPERRDPTDATIRVLTIVNKKGLHTRGSETVGGTSIMGLMMLGAATGTTITVEATGKEATAAIEAIDKLVSSGFGEED
jgi:phosphocarrier protein HPr